MASARISVLLRASPMTAMQSGALLGHQSPGLDEVVRRREVVGDPSICAQMSTTSALRRPWRRRARGPDRARRR
ncbi:hypothetical protein BJF90_13610 [Pseudonocardia sp. CNS-004]|nr:hypothetical protein BJF90_13610 [Pseudonocardia sp. CNS-004]